MLTKSWLRLIGNLMLIISGLSVAPVVRATPEDDQRLHELDQLSAMWSFYKFHYIESGRVVSLDEGRVTTSEGQSYAMLRAVWSNDPETFAEVWRWTKQNLQERGDFLFAWKYKDRILDRNSASDADCDIAMALLLAAKRFEHRGYQDEALAIIKDIWQHEVVETKTGQAYVVAGDWAKRDAKPKIHLGYFAPNAYALFADADPSHPWEKVISSGYELLLWGFEHERWQWPPEHLFLNKKNNTFSYTQKGALGTPAPFSYDVFPLFWRLAVDKDWNLRGYAKVRSHLLSQFKQTYLANRAVYDKYTVKGKALSSLEALPLYATAYALALQEDESFAQDLYRDKIMRLETAQQDVRETPYYLQNWLWFSKAFTAQSVRTYDEFLGFLRPFNFRSFWRNFPTILLAILLVSVVVGHWLHGARVIALCLCLLVATRYLLWRATTFNTANSFAFIVSCALYAAEIYSYVTVVLLIVQAGWRKVTITKDLTKENLPAVQTVTSSATFAPRVAVMIPIYSEPLAILETTLIGCKVLNYPAKQVYVLDDGHRAETKVMAELHGAVYIKGPKKHAKAGNLNHALTQTDEPLIVVFDTDHIPMTTFLQKTVPHFQNEKVAFVQTPHVFYNPDIFQRAFAAEGLVPHEGDMFNHAIQALKNRWGGAIFAGSGAVFRRQALASIGGFKLQSITEDIHTSQHLHAKGWSSVFVDENLAVGLEAENFSSFLTQRKRWMQGCLQIMFKDNALRTRGLPLRHRLGYFASHYYFLYPLSRLIYWFVPLLFLLFHHYPLLADVSILGAYTLPFFLVLFMANHLLIPNWPRIFWNSLYETSITFPLIGAMVEQMLPKKLGFKVTPKGLTSQRRSFDWRSSRINIAVWCMSLIAIAKGVFEMSYFGIEKDAYFFNLAWAIFNFIFLSAGLLIAWERPQRRQAERVNVSWLGSMQVGGRMEEISVRNLSLGGMRVVTGSTLACNVNDAVEISVSRLGKEITIPLKILWIKVQEGRTNLRLQTDVLDADTRESLLQAMFADPEVWRSHHEHRTTSYLMTIWAMIRGVLYALLPGRK